MDEAAPAAAGTAAKKKLSLLRRVPTSLMVTLLGIGLSAWLLPAFTRQWDDRQKARELQTSIVGQITAASAQAIIDGEGAIEVTARNNNLDKLSRGPIPAAVRDLSIAQAQIRAELSAYFGPPITTEWRFFSRLVNLTLLVAHRRSPLETNAEPPSGYGLSGTAAALGSGAIGAFLKLLDPPHPLPEYRRLARALQAFEDQLIIDLLDAHPRGYSTTWHDLLRDLIP